MNSITYKALLVLSAITLFLSAQSIGLAGPVIFVGPDGSSPAEQFDPAGVFLGTFGTNNSSAAVVSNDGSGLVYSVTPGDISSTIYEYNSDGTFLNTTFTFTSGISNANGTTNYITDAAWAAPGILWVSGSNGVIYKVSLSGSTATVIDSFDTGNAFTGVATDGTNVYTTGGVGALNSLTASDIFQWSNSGGTWSNAATFVTPLQDTLGIGFVTDGTFWVGGFDVVSHVDTAGDLLGQFQANGQNSGVELGTLEAASGVPEPSTAGMLLLAGAALLVFRKRAALGSAILSFVAVGGVAQAAVVLSSITTDVPQPQPVGATITITANASDTDAGNLRYRFRIRPTGASAWTIVQDFAPQNQFAWTPVDHEGSHDIEVAVLNRTTGTSDQSTTTYSVSAVATSGPVATATANPLVGLYSAPSCPAGAQMRVRFKRAVELTWQSTATKTCDGVNTMNFYVAGMLPSQSYSFLGDVIANLHVTSLPAVQFNTGAASIPMPNVTTPKALVNPTRSIQGVTLFSVLNQTFRPFAVDPNANLIWYYAPSVNWGYLTRPIPGGDMLSLYGYSTDFANSGFLEFDLAGNTIKKTNVEQLNAQLTAMGQANITVVHHEVRQLTNGNYLLLAETELLSNAQSTDGSTQDIAGDMVLVLDPNLTLLWTWNSFDHLDVTRKAILNETCITGPGQCVLTLASTANDWLHTNSVALTPDGNLLISLRHQDWLIKVAYANGTGDGHVIWRMGLDGDFTINSSDPYPWFSHEHDAEYESANVISLFDNGNTRVAQLGGDSRGMVLQVDEPNRVVTPQLSVDLGFYSFALGSAQRLANGNYAFLGGIIGGTNTQFPEYTPSASQVANIASDTIDYRGFRLRDLYSAPW